MVLLFYLLWALRDYDEFDASVGLLAFKRKCFRINLIDPLQMWLDQELIFSLLRLTWRNLTRYSMHTVEGTRKSDNIICRQILLHGEGTDL